MSRAIKSLNLLAVIILIVAILGCGSDGGGQGTTVPLTELIVPLTELDFARDPGLRADPEKNLIVVFLEHPVSVDPGNDTGEVGNDTIPFRYSHTLEQTFCWEDDDADAGLFMVLEDSEGNEILRLDVGDCVTVVIEPGDYEMIITHDGRFEETLPIFIIPELNGDIEAKKEETIPGGILERAGRVLSKVLENLDISITQTTNAQSVPELVQTLLKTRACVGCILFKAKLIGEDLTGVDLSGANLQQAILYQSILTNVTVSQKTDLSLATAPNGGKFPPNSLPMSSGVIGTDTVIKFPNPEEHLITFKNNCNVPVWIGVIFSSAPALPFLPAKNNTAPPLWATCDNDMTGQNCTTPSWRIPKMSTRAFSLPFGFTSGVIAPRTGCVVDNLCCTDTTGTNCDVGANLCTMNSDCKAPNPICAQKAALRCKVGTCDDFRNCGQQEKGSEPSTTFEMSMDQAQDTTDFVNFYNVSMVAANHILAKIVPTQMGCPSVGNCMAVPDCPWSRVVQANRANMRTGILQNYAVATPDESGVCLAPDKMIGTARFATILQENPFQNLESQTDEFFRLGCVANDPQVVPQSAGKVCGATLLETPPTGTGDIQFYGCSPFFNKLGAMSEMEGFDPGGCITEFGRDSSGNIRGCTKDNCAKNNLTPRGQEDDKRAYSTKQMCDPYGQCDTALGRTAAWPDGVWPQGCTVPGCVPGAAVKSTAYLESVKDQCGTFEKNPPMALGAYSWQFDDPPLVGTAGALATCPPDVNAPGATSKTDFTVTLNCN